MGGSKALPAPRLRVREVAAPDFLFRTDDASNRFCRDIVELLVGRSGLSPEEAVRRVNALWEGQDFLGEDGRYRWMAGVWATHLYHFYEHMPPH